MTYTLEFKEKVVKEFINGATITELSDKYHIAPSTVFFWHKYFIRDKRYTSYPHQSSLNAVELTKRVRNLEKKVLELSKRLSELESKLLVH